MRLIFATIVAAATLTTMASPVLADGERGRGQHDQRGDNRGHSDPNHGYNNNNRDNNRHNGQYERRDQRHHSYRHQDYRRDDRQNDNRGARYWGPSARQWSHWDNSWGDPNRYARQWGFDRYDHNRGWQRGNTWYANPSQWSDWGGWSWSFSVGSGGYGNGYGNNYGNNNYYQQNANCSIYRTQDWVNGRRAIVVYQGCADRWGQVFEQPGTRRVERWGW
jgi:hypothetical protein